LTKTQIVPISLTGRRSIFSAVLPQFSNGANMNHDNATAGEFLRSASDIAAFLSGEFNRPVRASQVYQWATTGRLRIGRFAGKLVTTKSGLREQLRNIALAS